MQIIISPARPIFVTISMATLAAKAGAKFEPTFESLKQYRCPEWFRDAEFVSGRTGVRNASRKPAIGMRGTCTARAPSV